MIAACDSYTYIISLISPRDMNDDFYSSHVCTVTPVYKDRVGKPEKLVHKDRVIVLQLGLNRGMIVESKVC